MKIAIACDHGGLCRKQQIAAYLEKEGYAKLKASEVMDFGTSSPDSCDYPDFALPAAEAVAKKTCERGILVCTTGIGMCIAANKVRGVRCALCTEEHGAEMSRLHNDANMLALGAAMVDEDKALSIVKTFLETNFSGEDRHMRRIQKISDIEQSHLI